MFTSSQIEIFKMALGKSNAPGNHSREALISFGDDICNAIVETHETLEDHIAARGRRADETYEADGHTLHVWKSVQFRKGQPRRDVYYMDFGGLAAGMIG